ncbi:DUF916 and DUF3324 domain-containing protein [Lactococcus garvieae]|nr:DUF916 and DUF3324 domain-containing protein [Lactococcus garvieae]
MKDSVYSQGVSRFRHDYSRKGNNKNKMNYKKIKFLIAVFTLCLIPTLFPSSTKADTAGFSVVPILDENQVKPGLGYFNLLLDPSQSKKLEFNIYNNGDEPIKIETTFGTSFTGDAGNVLYTPKKYKSDSSLEINIKEYVKLPKEVTVPAHSKMIVAAEVTMPKEKFTGVIAGGFNFNEKDTQENENKSNNSKDSTSITNRYAYVIGLVLQNSVEKVQPELSLGKVGASQRNNRNIISANLHNSARAYLLDMDVDAVVKSTKDENVKYTFNSSSMEMAPNSNFDLAIPVSIQGALKENQTSEPLKPGQYKMTLTVFGGKNKNGRYQKLTNGQVTKYDNKWTFNKSFTITEAQSKELNSKDVTVDQKDETPWLLYILVAVVFLLIFIILLLLFKQRKQTANLKK